MIVYLVKSTVLLGLLWGLYALLLENEKMHRFNRFYLLAALVIGLTAPLIQFNIQPNSKVGGIDLVQIDQIVEAPSEFVVETIKPLVTDTPIPEEQLTVPYITPRYNTFALLLILAYIAIATIFLGKFVFGLHEIFTSHKKGKIITWKDTALVLMDEAVTPQSFLKWIFLNREDYESGKIGDEILEHERTHIKQKHSLDVLIIEALKVVFWFNPFIYGFRNAILLNHEFLADEHVVTHVSDRKKYQETLLRFTTTEKATSLGHRFSQSNPKRRLKKLAMKNRKKLSTLKGFSVFVALLILSTACLEYEVQDNSSLNGLTKELVTQFDLKKVDIDPRERSALDSLKHALIRLDTRINMNASDSVNSDQTRSKLVLSKLNSELIDLTNAYIEKAVSENPPSLEELELDYAYLWGTYTFISEIKNQLTSDPLIQFSSGNFPSLVPKPQELLNNRSHETN
jgi:hypothetical protein